MSHIKFDNAGVATVAAAWCGVGAVAVAYCEHRYWCCRTGHPTDQPARSLIWAIDAALWPITVLSCWVRHGDTTNCHLNDARH